MALTGVKEISASEVKGAEADKKGKFFSVLKVFSDIFIPIIPAFVGAAIIIGLKSLIVANGLFGMEGSLADHSEFLKNLASFFAIIATTFDYLPVLVMYSAVKRFGGNPILGILVGIVMVHPSLMNLTRSLWTRRVLSTGTLVRSPFPWLLSRAACSLQS